MGERASSWYRSTSPVRRADRAFDCGERWVRVDGRVCELMYVSCYCTAREEVFGWFIWGMMCSGFIILYVVVFRVDEPDGATENPKRKYIY